MEVSTRFNIGDYVYYLTPSGIRKSEIIHITITDKAHDISGVKQDKYKESEKYSVYYSLLFEKEDIPQCFVFESKEELMDTLFKGMSNKKL
jgi:hypothetical protein